MSALCDVNVLVALLHARHIHASRAVAWLDTQDNPRTVLICRVAHMGALRILTNAKWMKEDVISAAAFWRGWDQLHNDDRFAFVQEPAGLEASWRRITTMLPKGQNAETDTYFAAFAIASACRLLTFDQGFRKFSGLDVELLL